MPKPVLPAVILLAAQYCAAQPPERLILKVDQESSGPLTGQRASLCLRAYSTGRVTMSEWATASVSVVDEAGKESRAEHEVNLEFKFPERDAYKISEIEELLQSKSIGRLPPRFDPPHPPVDFFENTLLSIAMAKGRSKTISVKDYYGASLAERAKYPSGLVILMERIARLEDEVSENGKPAPRSSDCKPNLKSVSERPQQ